MTAMRQLALPFRHAPLFSAADYLPAESNAEALAWLARPASWPGHRLALWGEEGSGKTHLLHAWAERNAATLLPGEMVRGLVPLPEGGGVAVDDADAAPEPTALLHLLNAAAEAGLPVLLAGREPPARWPVPLPDLASRLRATTAVRLRPPEETLLRALFARLLAERQLTVPPALQDWLLPRLPRTGAALREAAARLDRAALASGGRVTRPLAAAVLADMTGEAEDAAPAGESPEPPALL
ncbi:MAG TPA: chromosomal replication initiator DnaA [Acetobacteraceae bacterium]|nr:chromosomal replication initiator DnaA [Acetobacteraceae bacterium]